MIEFKIIKLEQLKTIIDQYIEYFNTCEDSNWYEDTVIRKFRQLVERYDYLGLGLYEDDVLIGFAVGQLIQFDDGLVALLNELFIVKSKQSRGFGTLLLRDFEKLAKEKGAFRIQLEAANDDIHHRFYNERHNYKDASSNILKAKSLN